MLFANKFSLEFRLKIAIALILFSFLLVFAGLDRQVSLLLLHFDEFGALLAGAFYTFGITTPFSMVVILEIMKLNNPLTAAIAASLAAATVNIFLFSTVRESLERSAKNILHQIDKKFSKYRHTYPLVGFFIFGMPLPDELGLALMGMTKIEVPTLWATIFLSKFFTLILFWKTFQ
ncbi:MAG: hypothetical protein QW275_01010 [Candidatus Anstonellaceae archaeon]